MSDQFGFVEVVLPEDKSRYESGQEVSGVFRMKLKGQSILSNMKILLISVAEVKWVENPGTRFHRAGHLYHDKMRLVKLSYALPKKCEYLQPR